MHNTPLQWFFKNRSKGETIADVASQLDDFYGSWCEESLGEFFEEYKEEIKQFFRDNPEEFDWFLDDNRPLDPLYVAGAFAKHLTLEYADELRTIVELEELKNE